MVGCQSVRVHVVKQQGEGSDGVAADAAKLGADSVITAATACSAPSD